MTIEELEKLLRDIRMMCDGRMSPEEVEEWLDGYEATKHDLARLVLMLDVKLDEANGRSEDLLGMLKEAEGRRE